MKKYMLPCRRRSVSFAAFNIFHVVLLIIKIPSNIYVTILGGSGRLRKQRHCARIVSGDPPQRKNPQYRTAKRYRAGKGSREYKYTVHELAVGASHKKQALDTAQRNDTERVWAETICKALCTNCQRRPAAKKKTLNIVQRNDTERVREIANTNALCTNCQRRLAAKSKNRRLPPAVHA